MMRSSRFSSCETSRPRELAVLMWTCLSWFGDCVSRGVGQRQEQFGEGWGLTGVDEQHREVRYQANPELGSGVLKPGVGGDCREARCERARVATKSQRA